MSKGDTDMSDKHKAYDEELQEYAQNKLNYAFLDICEELDNIERTLETEASKILLNWIRDSILRVQDNYKP